jgi:predicted ArsR family transcriptional regulator
MTPKDRRRVAEHGSREWTMQRIADALGVGFTTVQRDLSNLSTVDKLGPKGRGRPKGARPKPPVTRKGRRQRYHATMSNAPKTTAEIIAEGAAELIELCNRLPNKRLGRRNAPSDGPRSWPPKPP